MKHFVSSRSKYYLQTDLVLCGQVGHVSSRQALLQTSPLADRRIVQSQRALLEFCIARPLAYR